MEATSSRNFTWMQSDDYAVIVRNACKSYGKKSNLVKVLINLDMTVPKGVVYGLLGASGCGKTTLLSCVVGRLRLDSGEIMTLHDKPGMHGKRIGYMPQELALYGEFTIRETMLYFGWLFDMRTDAILNRLQFLLAFLDLPIATRQIKNLSGGQQRRVSLAVALLHNPELLILDEPTVGVDPLLRQTIWEYLSQIVSDRQKTIILTTHYIEEARQADVIGLMRSGQLLAEAPPAVLLLVYKGKTLEDVFLRLSHMQFQEKNNPDATKQKLSKQNLLEDSRPGRRVTFSDLVAAPSIRSTESEQFNLICCNVRGKLNACHRLQALLYRNYLRIWRNVGLVLFIFVLPVLQVILFCLTIGREPQDLHVAIINAESHDAACNWSKGCAMTNLGCRYLSHLKGTIRKEYHKNLQEGQEAVRAGAAWGVIHIQETFSKAIFMRALKGQGVDEKTFKDSEINVWLDMSNQQIGIILQRDIQLAYSEFIQTLMRDCGKNPKLAEFPIHFKDPIYGPTIPSFTDFVAPGVILTRIVFFLAVGLTASAFIIEKTEGLLHRTLVAGVTSAELLLSHIISQLMVTIIQTGLVLFSIFVLFHVTNNGNLWWVLMLALLQGICGMCYGFLISAICDQERSAIQVALGSFYPIMMLSGVMWPIEGMPIAVRYFALCLPLTLPTEAMRSILSRGWSAIYLMVYAGFLTTFLWIICFLALTMLSLHLKRL